MHEDLIIHWWYLYKDLDLTKSDDKEEYKELIENRSQILAYQNKTSEALNHFFEAIEQDINQTCTDNDNVRCLESYLSTLYGKLKAEVENPRSWYLGNDPVLYSYYNDLKGSHPFINYYLDFYDYISSHAIKQNIPAEPFWRTWSEDPNSENKFNRDNESQFLHTWASFYTFWWGNVNIFWDESALITNIDSGIVVHKDILQWISSKYWYQFAYGPLNIANWTAPMHWPFLKHYNDWKSDYLYQIARDGGWSWEFYLMVWKLINKIWVPIGECWYLLFPDNPQLFWECRTWENHDVITIMTQEYNLYEEALPLLVEKLKFFLKSLESTRVLSH